MTQLPSEHEINEAAERFDLNCKLLGYTPIGELLDTDQAAKLSKCARRTLEDLRMKGGSPPFIKQGRRVFYPEPLLVDWLAKKLQTNTYYN